MPFSKKRKMPYKKKMPAKTSVAALTKKVNSLVKARQVNTQWLNMQRNDNNTIAQFYWYNVCNYGSGNPMFGTSTDDFADPKVRFYSSQINCRVSLENSVNNEEETTRFTAFLVSLKDRIPQTKFNNTTGTLTLTPALDYNLISGVAYLNQKLFTIHRTKRFTLTNYGTALSAPAAQSEFGTAHEWTWSITPNCVIENPNGNWNTLSSSMDPSKQYYVLVFSDNQTGDLENPSVVINQIYNFKRIASA